MGGARPRELFHDYIQSGAFMTRQFSCARVDSENETLPKFSGW